MAKGENNVSFERKYLCCYASRKEDIPYLHSHEEIIEQYGADICQVDQVPGVFASALGELGYIFRTEKMDRLQEIIRFIHQADKDKEL